MTEAFSGTDIKQDKSYQTQEHVTLLLHKSTTAIAVNLSIAFITYLAIPSSNYTWLWLIIGASFLRLVLYLLYERCADLSHHYRALYRVVLTSIFLQGAAWGVASIVLYVSATDMHKFYLIAIVCGLSGGAILTLTPSLTGFVCFTIPSTVPIVLAFLMESEESFKHAGLMGIVFIVAVIFLARRIRRSHSELLNSRSKLERTSWELAQHKDHLEAIVQERTQALENSRESYRQLTEEINDVIFEIDHNGVIKYVSPAITPILGYSSKSLIGAHYTDMVCPKDLEMVQAEFPKVISGDLRPTEYRMVDSNGDLHWVRTSSRPIFGDDGPIGLRGVLADIENEKRSEIEKEALLKRINESKKLEAMGTLAGGIAHDFNNLLMGIQGHCSLLASDLDTFDSSSEHILAIEELVRSAYNLTAQLLGTARGGKYDPKATDLNELVKNSSTLFSRSRKEIQLKVETVQSALVAEVERPQIEQVLLNMYVNAWQAMPDGGVLQLQTEKVLLDDSFCEPYHCKGGGYARISVTDSGVGMDEKTRERVFDPFFTTKDKERGTGLGLSSAYGIIKNHHGFMTVYSEVGHGTTFNIYLPLSEKRPHHKIQAESQVVGGSERILLIDDEEMILKVGRAMLEKLGYDVVAVQGGVRGVDKLRNSGERIDLVILDMIMPDMDGEKTFMQIRNLIPSLPVILSSGYTLDGQAAEIMRRGCNGFIQKPFNMANLSRTIRRVLDGEEKLTDG